MMIEIPLPTWVFIIRFVSYVKTQEINSKLVCMMQQHWGKRLTFLFPFLHFGNQTLPLVHFPCHFFVRAFDDFVLLNCDWRKLIRIFLHVSFVV